MQDLDLERSQFSCSSQAPVEFRLPTLLRLPRAVVESPPSCVAPTTLSSRRVATSLRCSEYRHLCSPSTSMPGELHHVARRATKEIELSRRAVASPCCFDCRHQHFVLASTPTSFSDELHATTTGMFSATRSMLQKVFLVTRVLLQKYGRKRSITFSATHCLLQFFLQHYLCCEDFSEGK